MPVPLVFGQWQPMFFWAECAQALLPGVCTSAPRPPEGSESMQRVETGTERSGRQGSSQDFAGPKPVILGHLINPISPRFCTSETGPPA